MTITPGKRAQEEANAQATRFINRDLRQMIQGLINDYDHTGSRLVRHLLRHFRLDRHRNRSMKHHFLDDQHRDVWGNPWKIVDSVELVGFQYDSIELATLLYHLEALRQQIPDIIDFHEFPSFSAIAVDVPISSLGKMRSPLKDLVGVGNSHKLES